MTTFQVKTVTNIRFSNRKEDEWIKSADVTFSIVYLPMPWPFPAFAVFYFRGRGSDRENREKKKPAKKTRLTVNIV